MYRTVRRSDRLIMREGGKIKKRKTFKIPQQKIVKSRAKELKELMSS